MGPVLGYDGGPGGGGGGPYPGGFLSGRGRLNTAEREREAGRPAPVKSLPEPAREAWTLTRGTGPLVAVAIHDGHRMRPEVAIHVALTEDERLREEDPRTGDWTSIAPTRVVVHRSRFEVDLNRPPEGAVYLSPEQAWGLGVWRDAPLDEVVRDGLLVHTAFYEMLEGLLREIEAEHGRFLLYDLHSYNHRRGGPRAPPDDARKNPDVNLGTASLDRRLWQGVVDAFLETLSATEVMGRRLDVRENVRFLGGYLPQWVHRTFPGTGCALAIEVKKFFMDEWTGEVEPALLAAVGTALARTVPPVLEALERTA